MTATELGFASAADLGRRIARREISPVEVATALLDRIHRLDAGLGSYLTVTRDRALADARAAEKEIASGDVRGPLHGVPIALKDLFDTAGIRTTAGSRILRDHVPARDAHVVTLVRAAGMPLLGKTSLHEFAFGTTNANPHYGDVRNPWDRERVPGGSSGGSGAAIAAGLAPLSLGTDTGGSIRIPAAACGVVGLKPTFGRVSRRGAVPLAWSLDHVGPMGRTVEDVARLFEVIAAPDAEDPWCARSFADPIERLEDGIIGLRVGVPHPGFDAGLHPDVTTAVAAAIALLDRLGARVSTIRWPALERTYTAFHTLMATEACAFHRPWLKARPAEYADATRRALEVGAAIAAVDYVDARRVQQIVRGEFEAVLRDVDVIVAPTIPRPALALGAPVSREPIDAWNRLVMPFNLAGVPAASVPCGFDRAGLPIGLQIAGRPFDEATVLRVARAYERETEWSSRRPPGLD